MFNVHKSLRGILIFSLSLTLLSLSFGITAFAYNSDYLEDTSWVDSDDAVTKSVGYDGDNGIMSCAVSYLVDENNSAVYFQVLANNFGINKDSDVRLYFDVLADSQSYSFYVDKSGLQSNNDYSKLFAAKSNFSSSKDIGTGTYLVALDIKTKASVNKVHITLAIDSMKYDLLDGIALNALTTTKKPTTTKVKAITSARTTTQRTSKNVGEVTVEIAKSTTEKSKKSTSKSTGSTKFVGKNKYHTTVKSENDTKYSPTGTTAQTAVSQEQDTTETVWHTYDKDMSYSTKMKITIAVASALGVVGLLLTGFAIGKASNKKEQKKDEDDKSSDDEKIIDDDFEF